MDYIFTDNKLDKTDKNKRKSQNGVKIGQKLGQNVHNRQN